MKSWIVIAILLSASASWAEKAYLNTEDGRVISVFNSPGKNWKNCKQESRCEAVGWPDNRAVIETLSPPKKMKVNDPETGELKDEEYVFVEFSYERVVKGVTHKQTNRGWIDAAYLSKKKQKGFYTQSQPQAKKEVCDPKTKNAPIVPKELEVVNTALENQNITETAEALKAVVGQCVINPKATSIKSTGGNSYDDYVLPQLLKQKLPKVTNENGKLLSTQELIDIDALARTLYGEMAGCFKHGLQYPMAVARIAYNRAQASDRAKEFIRSPHSSTKAPLAKVVTSDTQFNVWMTNHGSKPNNSLKLALCPPSNKAKPSWQGHLPAREELDIWEDALRIATETVLFPKHKFEKRTAQIRQLHYTSGMGAFYNMKQVFPWVEERKVSRSSCVEIWQERPKT